MASIDQPDHSFIVMLPIATVAVLAIEVCDGSGPDADLSEVLRGIGSYIDRCMYMAGVFENCTGSSQRMSAITSTNISHAHTALLKAARQLLQCSIVQVYDVEWSLIGSGTRSSEQIPTICRISPDSSQTGAKEPPLPPGVGAVWRAVTRAEVVLVRRCADDAVFRRGIDCPYDNRITMQKAPSCALAWLSHVLSARWRSSTRGLGCFYWATHWQLMWCRGGSASALLPPGKSLTNVRVLMMLCGACRSTAQV
jgi:hypothetical protein